MLFCIGTQLCIVKIIFCCFIIFHDYITLWLDFLIKYTSIYFYEVVAFMNNNIQLFVLWLKSIKLKIISINLTSFSVDIYYNIQCSS